MTSRIASGTSPDVVWRAFTEAAMARVERVSEEFRGLGLSPGHVRSLLVLEPDDPRPMRWFADHFMIDASTVTWIVDRLEEKGLVRRSPLERDRRIKVVVLTPFGKQTKAALEAALFTPPEGFAALPSDVLEQMHEAIIEHGIAEGDIVGPERVSPSLRRR